MAKKEEVSVFFYTDNDTLREFNEAIKAKSKRIGIELNKKQAYNLALKEISELWKKENPAK